MKKILIPALIIIVLLILLLSLYKSQELKKVYRKEVSSALKEARGTEKEILTEDDIKHLPGAVQKYLIYTGALGREKVNNMRVITEGEFKSDPKRDWSRIKTEQYNFFADPTRIYYLKLKMFGLPVIGLHSYSDATASMLIKLGGIITVAKGAGPEMDQGETVTVFNDMCLLAPASLIDERIEWETIDENNVKAYFSNNDQRISAQLSFNEEGQLINFFSDDRFYSPTGETYQKVRWSTPVKDYREINGMKLPTYGEAIWHFPEGNYSYAKLSIKEVEYNLSELK